MNQLKKILIVEDEAKIRSLVKIYLEKESYRVEEAADGKEALAKIAVNNYSLIILDLMLPEIDGMEVCRKIRAHSEVPIMMLTAKNDELDRLVGFEMGADDYVVKPFSPREVVARVKALLKRSAAPAVNTEKMFFGELEIDLLARRVNVNQDEVQLTPKEFDLLSYLALNQDQVFTQERILEKVWGYEYLGDLRTVYTHVKNLREKLKGKSTKEYIQTIWGVGYKFSG